MSLLRAVPAMIRLWLGNVKDPPRDRWPRDCSRGCLPNRQLRNSRGWEAHRMYTFESPWRSSYMSRWLCEYWDAMLNRWLQTHRRTTHLRRLLSVVLSFLWKLCTSERCDRVSLGYPLCRHVWRSAFRSPGWGCRPGIVPRACSWAEGARQYQGAWFWISGEVVRLAERARHRCGIVAARGK